MVPIRAIKMSTKDFGMDLGSMSEIYCVPENKFFSLTAGDNGKFISDRILLQINKF